MSVFSKLSPPYTLTLEKDDNLSSRAGSYRDMSLPPGNQLGLSGYLENGLVTSRLSGSPTGLQSNSHSSDSLPLFGRIAQTSGSGTLSVHPHPLGSLINQPPSRFSATINGNNLGATNSLQFPTNNEEFKQEMRDLKQFMQNSLYVLVPLSLHKHY
jgi:hypothetical protein